jgi:hypothetical protein
MMKCPKCGYERPPEYTTPLTECAACGIVFAKFEAHGQAAAAAAAADSTVPEKPADKQPGPVDEQSVKQARAQVEPQLRKTSSPQQAEQDRNRTLQLAKQLAAEGVRRRREEWERNQRNSASAAPEPRQETAVTAAAVQEPPADPVKDREKLKPVPSAPRILPFKAPEPGFPKIPPENVAPMTDTAPGVPLNDPPARRQACEPPLQDERPKSPIHPLTALKRAGRSIHQRLGRPALWSVAAFIVLAVGLIGAVLSWTTIDSVSADMRANTLTAGSPPLALLLGFAYLAIGVLGFAFFWAASMVNGRFNEIRSLLLERQELSDKDPIE